MKFGQTVATSVIVSAAVAAPILYTLRTQQVVPPAVVENPPIEKRVIDVQPTPPGDDIPVIEVAIGELIHLTASGESVAWSSVPAVVDWLSFGKARGECVFSFREAGDYTVVVGVVVDGQVELRKVVLSVKRGEPEITVPISAWDGKIENWLAGNSAAKEGAAKLAESFVSVAAEVEAKLAKGELVTVDQIVEMTAASNQAALAGVGGDWTSFRNALSEELKRMATTGELTTMRQHIDHWRLIAAALRRVAARS